MESKITLRYEGHGVEITMSFDGEDSWREHMEKFRNFLNGISYNVPAGSWEEEDDNAYTADDTAIVLRD